MRTKTHNANTDVQTHTCTHCSYTHTVTTCFLRGQTASCVNTAYTLNSCTETHVNKINWILLEKSKFLQEMEICQHVCSVVSYSDIAEFIILSYYFRLCISGRKANGTLHVYLTSNSQPVNYTVFKGAARMVSMQDLMMGMTTHTLSLTHTHTHVLQKVQIIL